MVEHRSPKPGVAGSSPVTPAIGFQLVFFMNRIKKFFSGFIRREIFKNSKIFLKSFLYTSITLIKLIFNDFYWFINNFKIENIPIGDLIYDLYIRKNENFINNKIDFFDFGLGDENYKKYWSNFNENLFRYFEFRTFKGLVAYLFIKFYLLIKKFK